MTLPSRKTQLWLLIILSALTMAIPYAIQGALSTGSAPSAIRAEVYLADQIAWAIRALVEGLVIGYIARTHASSKLQGFVLWILKIALIGLIAITLGPVLYATSTGKAISETMSDNWHRFWAYALASYMPLMVLGASYAYKTQPTDEMVQPVDNEQLAELQEAVINLEQQRDIARADANELVRKIGETKEGLQTAQLEIDQLQGQVEALQIQAKTVDAWNILNATAKATWIAEHTNGDRPPASQLAKVLGCAVSTVSRAYESVDKRN